MAELFKLIHLYLLAEEKKKNHQGSFYLIHYSNRPSNELKLLVGVINWLESLIWVCSNDKWALQCLFINLYEN